MENLKMTWELDTIFPGGSESPELKLHLEDLKKDIRLLKKEVATDIGDWRSILDRLQDVGQRLGQARSFISCLNAQDVNDKKARLLFGVMQQLQASYQSVLTSIDRYLLALSEEKWRQLTEAMPELAFNLAERRSRAALEMDGERERLVNDLAVDGYHGWADLYNLVTGRITILFEKDGKKQDLSVGQAFNIFSDPDNSVRSAMAEKWEAAWAQEAELCANALNHLAGFRLNLYRHRGWDSVLDEPLRINRISKATLDAMWAAIETNKDVFVDFLKRKATFLGLKRMGWFDLHAPLGKTARKYNFDEGANFVTEQFRQFSPRMAEFATQAFLNRWVEAEDRPGKRQGAFCTSLPASDETRVFMTYAGSINSVSTLAHELGHAFHQHVMQGLPFMAKRYPMTLAETASTFAEMVVVDAALKQAENKEEKIILLGGKVNNNISFFMDIHTRFLFELNFYKARKEGPLSVDQLNYLMENAQKHAFKNSLATWHPHFWAAKLHFYITANPFYNFPYTFGYLFSAGVYARGLEEGKGFEQKYIDLLRDTGRMKVEDLAQKHLGVNLSQPEFWQQGVELFTRDAKEFLALTEV